MSFTPEEVSRGALNDLITTLLKFNENLEDRYCEIRIWYDGYCTIVEWDVVPLDHEYGGTFQYIDEYHTVIDLNDTVDDSIE